MPKLDSRIYGAALRSSESQLLSDGGARIYKDENRGAFLPQDQPNVENILNFATIVQIEDGTEIRICRVKYQRKGFPSDGHFEFDIQKGQDSILATLGMPKF